MADDPPLPRIAIPAILKLRDRIINDVALGYEYDRIEGEILYAFARELKQALAGRKVADRAILETVRANLSGRKLDDATLREFAWRVAGNLGELKAGRPVVPWTAATAEKEWLPLEVTAAVRSADHFGRPGFEYTFRCLAGSFCPGLVRKSWTMKAIGHVARRKLGFTPGWGELPFSDGRQLVGLRLLGLAERELSQGGKPGFKRVECSATMVERNRTILRFRLRKGSTCPFGYLHPCHNCTHGYARPRDQRCFAAVHASQYQTRPCPGCGRAEAVFDPDLSAVDCIACVERKLTHPTS